MRDRVVIVSQPHRGLGKADVRPVCLGADHQRVAIRGNRRIEAFLAQEVPTQIRVGHPRRGVLGDGVPPQSLLIFVDLALAPDQRPQDERDLRLRNERQRNQTQHDVQRREGLRARRVGHIDVRRHAEK